MLAAAAGGCAHVGAGIERGGLSGGRPAAEAIVAGLAENDSQITNFSAAVSVTLESPDLAGPKRFRHGRVAFRRPDDLYILGRNDIGMGLFRLTSVESEFLIEFPSSSDKPYYRLKGESLEEVPFSVSPSDIAREMFMPVHWSQVNAHDVRLTDYDAASQTATIELGARHSAARKLTVEGPPWDVVRSELLDEKGATVAVITKEAYETYDGVRFPTIIDAFFPTRQTRMLLRMRNVKVNTELDSKMFDVRDRAREAGVIR